MATCNLNGRAAFRQGLSTRGDLFGDGWMSEMAEGAAMLAQREAEEQAYRDSLVQPEAPEPEPEEPADDLDEPIEEPDDTFDQPEEPGVWDEPAKPKPKKPRKKRKAGVWVPWWMIHLLKDPRQAVVLSYILYWFDSKESTGDYESLLDESEYAQRVEARIKAMQRFGLTETDLKYNRNLSSYIVDISRPAETAIQQQREHHPLQRINSRIRLFEAGHAYPEQRWGRFTDDLARTKWFTPLGWRILAQSHHEMAAALGMDRHSLVRTLERLKREGWIKLGVVNKHGRRNCMPVGRKLGPAFAALHPHDTRIQEALQKDLEHCFDWDDNYAYRNRRLKRKQTANGYELMPQEQEAYRPEWFESATRALAMNRRRERYEPDYGLVPVQAGVWLAKKTLAACKGEHGPALLLSQLRHLQRQRKHPQKRFVMGAWHIVRSAGQWAREFGVGRNTLRGWVSKLEGLGLIDKLQASGWDRALAMRALKVKTTK